MFMASLLRCFTPEEPTGWGFPTQLLTVHAWSSLRIVNADSASLCCSSSSFSSFSFSAPSDDRTLTASLSQVAQVSVRGSAKPRLNSPLKMSLYVCSRMWAFSFGGIGVVFSC